mgnify:CR=1 FL=1
MSVKTPELTPPAIRGSRIALEALGLGLLFLGIFVLLSPDAFYKADAQHLVWRLIGRNAEYPHHRFYMPTLIAFGDLVAPLGLTPFEVARLFSQVGGALAIAFAHAGFRRLVGSPRIALLATLLFALCPAIVFFSNVVEFHGPFLAFAALAFLIFSFAVGDEPAGPGELVLAAALGLSTSVAAGMHASGMLLPAIFLPWWLLLRYRRGQLSPEGRWSWPVFAGPLVAALVHGGGLALFVRVQKSTEFLKEGFQHPQGIEHLPEIIFAEWLAPFLPLSLVPFILILGRRFRLESLFVIVALGPYLLGALRLLVGDSESGAYLLPLALPTAWLTATSLGWLRRSVELGKHAVPLALSILLISTLLAWARVEDFDRNEAYQQYAQSLRSCLDSDDALVMIGHPDPVDELGAVLLELPKLKIWLADEPTKYGAEQIRTGYFPAILPGLRKELEAGHSVYITDKARKFLLLPEASRLGGGPAFLELLEKVCRLERIERQGFVVYKLHLK